MSEEVKLTRDELVLKAKELYNKGSRNYLLKCYSEAADELSEVCALYEEIYGELSDELGMPYLLYAKSLIALALDENKVIDVPDQEEDDDEDDEEEDSEENVEAASSKQNLISETAEQSAKEKKDVEETVEASGEKVERLDTSVTGTSQTENEKPSTSNGLATTEEEEDNEAASSLQLAWEILELAGKIFSRQGLSGLPNLAEVQTELANIEFENNVLEAAREDYEKALQIYKGLDDKYRRAMAEIYYKTGLTFLMQQMNQEGAESLKSACGLIEDEINEMKAKEAPALNDAELIKDLEETKEEIWAKIAEIEETRQQNIDEVKAALDNFIGPAKKKADDEPSSSIITSSKPTDISHLIKRKKPDSAASSEAEAAPSPAKKPAI